MMRTIRRRSTQQEKRVDLGIFVTAGLLSLYVLTHWYKALHVITNDLAGSMIPWLEHIQHFGRLASVEGSFSNYSPPFVYLLILASLLDRWLSAVVIIKLGPMLFVVFTSVVTYNTCRALACSKRRALLAAWLVLVAPEIFLNTVVWGQCDIIHTFFILLFFRFMLSHRPAWAMASFGVGIAVKLQVVFMGPAILALLLTGEIPVWTISIVPLTYMLAMIPALIAGRPWYRILFVYTDQYGVFPALAMNVANPYQFLMHWAKQSEHLTTIFTLWGLAAAGVCTLILVIYLARLRPNLTSWRLLAALSLSLLIEPFVLPKMHDRYFFAGDTLLLLLTVVQPRIGALPALLMQGAAILAYIPYLHGTANIPIYLGLAMVMVLISIIFLIRTLKADSRMRSQAVTGATSGA
jgi:Gpi18-like mannosyltransferase